MVSALLIQTTLANLRIWTEIDIFRAIPLKTGHRQLNKPSLGGIAANSIAPAYSGKEKEAP
jgi:hypothetical protein